jgi:hypothetical protein
MMPPATIGIQTGRKSNEVKAAKTAQTPRAATLRVTE